MGGNASLGTASNMLGQARQRVPKQPMGHGNQMIRLILAALAFSHLSQREWDEVSELDTWSYLPHCACRRRTA